MYVLPFSETEALLEYTLFSGTPLAVEEYEEGIKNYIRDHLNIEKYQVVEKENGNIPMTCHPFWEGASKRIIPIGIAGGWAKASTGYTFKKSERKAKKLVRFLKTNRPLNRFGGLDRFWFYDLLLLDILDRKNELGSQVFGVLFKRHEPQLIFKFLDEQTNFWEELRIMASSDVWLFTDALFRNLNRAVHQVFAKFS
jgi:lycopene beta-cyclase